LPVHCEGAWWSYLFKQSWHLQNVPTNQYFKRAIDQIEARIVTLDQTIETSIKSWHFAPVVDALRALRGINTTIAATIVAEIGDITRFENPRQLMAWLGLVPSEHSSGSSIRRGRLTKTGNALARTMLVEAGWSYRHPPKEGHPYLKRSEHLPQQIRDIGWKAQTRLCKRYRHLSRAGKPQPRVIAAIARELAGFVWDIARKTPLPAWAEHNRLPVQNAGDASQW
jgi:transposase